MTKDLICVHGNPGFPQDFDSILKLPVFKDFHVLRFDAEGCKDAELSTYITELAKITGKEDKANYLCYSWGSYLCLQYLISSGLTANTIFMINPTLYTPSGVSPIVRTLTSLPLIGSILLGKLSPNLAKGFVEKSFAPITPDKELSMKLTGALSSPSVWKKAMNRKQNMFSNPITECPKVAEKIVLIRGLQDVSVPWEEQNALVQKLQTSNDVQIMGIDGAGHSLLWTHHSEIETAIGKAQDQNGTSNS